LNTWIDHLLLNTYARKGDPLDSVLASRDGQWSYSPVPESRALLQCLLALYWRGLKVPLRFFPESSYVYAAAVHKGKSLEQALAEAAREWKRSYKEIRAEEDDPYNRLGFGKINPFDEVFAELALDVFLPLLEHQQEEKL
jgi:exodeoxyribonuclease V gamma subunit